MEMQPKFGADMLSSDYADDCPLETQRPSYKTIRDTCKGVKHKQCVAFRKAWGFLKKIWISIMGLYSYKQPTLEGNITIQSQMSEGLYCLYLYGHKCNPLQGNGSKLSGTGKPYEECH